MPRAGEENQRSPVSSGEDGNELWESDIFGPDAWDEGPYTHPDSLDWPDAWLSDEPDDSRDYRQQQSTWDEPFLQGGDGDDSGSVFEAREGETQVAASTNEVYWPNIEEYILTRAGPRPLVICAICQTNQLVIEDLQPASGDGEEEEPLTLGCDHVVGVTCWYQWARAQQDDGRDIKCPICNVKVT
jgi:hypothetical protein